MVSADLNSNLSMKTLLTGTSTYLYENKNIYNNNSIFITTSLMEFKFFALLLHNKLLQNEAVSNNTYAITQAIPAGRHSEAA